MNIIDKIVMNLYLWRFPQKPLEQKKKPIFHEPQTIPIKTVHGVCWYTERSVINGFIDKDQINRSLVQSMIPELAKCLGPAVVMEKQDEYGTLRIEGRLDVVINNNDFKFGD